MRERVTGCRHEAFAYGPARDAGTRFVDRLREAGVPVEHYRVEGVLHAFHNFAGMLDRAPAISDTIGELVGRLVTEARSNA
jgi:acetyl esterase